MKPKQLKQLTNFTNEELIHIIEQFTQASKSNQDLLDALLASEKDMEKLFEKWEKKLDNSFWTRSGDLKIASPKAANDLLVWLKTFPQEEGRLSLILDFADNLALILEVLYRPDERYLDVLEDAILVCLDRNIEWKANHLEMIENIKSHSLPEYMSNYDEVYRLIEELIPYEEDDEEE